MDVDGFIWIEKPKASSLDRLCDEILLMILSDWYPSPMWLWICQRTRRFATRTPLPLVRFRCCIPSLSPDPCVDCIWHLDVTVPLRAFIMDHQKIETDVQNMGGCRDLRSLRYRCPGRFFSAQDGQFLSRLLQNNAHLRKLDLSLAHCSLRGNTLMYHTFFKRLFTLKSLRAQLTSLTLCLNDNPLFHNGAYILRALCRFNALRFISLDMRHCGLGDSDMFHLCDGPLQAPHLRSIIIHLGNNHVSDDGIVTLARCLLHRDSETNVHISLCLNDIGRHGLSIAEYIEKHHKNVRLDMQPQRSMINGDWADE